MTRQSPSIPLVYPRLYSHRDGSLVSSGAPKVVRTFSSVSPGRMTLHASKSPARLVPSAPEG